ncbi:50S ribosomal protein L24e [Nanoarchaeota archaeon]
MAKCTFCGNVIESGTGKVFVLKEGKALYFCSSKCEKNQLKLGRKAITTRWSTRFIK